MNADFKSVKMIIGVLVAIDLIIWIAILFPAEINSLHLYFLDVGQGDSSLVALPGGPKILIDGGKPNGKLQENLESILSPGDRYIDLVMISHPQLDHFGGLLDILRNYKIGAILTSRHGSEQAAWQELERIIAERNIPRIVLRAGDAITYQGSHFDILSPKDSDWARDINDLSLVGVLASGGVRTFFGGDISAEKERQLAESYNVDVDILKVSHHGSKYSSDSEFLREASPYVSAIGVGKNSYGHPTNQALHRLANIGSQVFRTDERGMIKLLIDGGKVKIYTSR